MQTPGYPIVLGNLSMTQCVSLAEMTREIDYPGVVGPGKTALCFAERAAGLGVEFCERIPQQIQLLRIAPQVPSVPGLMRLLGPKDFNIFRAWTNAFIREAIPSDPVPTGDALQDALRSRRHWLWIWKTDLFRWRQSRAAIEPRPPSIQCIHPPNAETGGSARPLPLLSRAKSSLRAGTRPIFIPTFGIRLPIAAMPNSAFGLFVKAGSSYAQGCSPVNLNRISLR